MIPPAPAHDRELLLLRLVESGQWDRVRTVAAEWLAEEPDNAQAHLGMAQALVNLRLHAAAEPHLAHALARAPHDAFAHRMMAIVQFELKRYREADKAIHDAIALSPEDPLNWYQLAYMCHAQHDLKNGLKWAQRARELAPGDPDILNLLLLCGGEIHGGESGMEEVLALDPEHALAHNNLGVEYLKAENYAKAEECFRRALMLQPTLDVARQNLFVAIKHRDFVYRVLCAPRDFLLWIRQATFGDGDRKRNAVEGAIGLLVWILIWKFVLVGFIFWVGLVWPLLKLYEFLVTGDLRKKAGEIGATRGGPLGFRRWPLALRLAMFVVGAIGFWILLHWFLWSQGSSEESRMDAATVWMIAVCGGLAFWFGRHLFKLGIGRFRAWKRERLLSRNGAIKSP
jgi:tetratricopeptide (TPR) repeat protein